MDKTLLNLVNTLPQLTDYKKEKGRCLINLAKWEVKHKQLQLNMDKTPLNLVNTLPQLTDYKKEKGRGGIQVMQKDMFGDDIEIKHKQLQLNIDKTLLSLVNTLSQLTDYKKGRERGGIQVMQKDIFGDDIEITNKATNDINFASQNKIKDLLLLIDKIIVESTDEDHIKLLVTEYPDAHLNVFLNQLLEFREYDRLISTYGESFLARLDANNYIHTSYTQCKTKTGRLSSLNPNLQNIPSKGAGLILRSFFIPKEGHTFITCDHNGAEVALAADFSGEPLLKDAILKGKDMHSELATLSFKIIFDDPNFVISNSEEAINYKGHTFIPNELRTTHKSVTFAKFYKAGKNTIYKTLSKFINMFHSPDKRLKIAGECSRALDKRMPTLTKFLDGMIAKAQKNGFLRGYFGRMRWMQDDVYGEAANYLIQNANAEAMKIALINLDKYLEELGYGRLVLTVHDEVVVEAPIDKAEEMSPNIERIMGDALTYFMKGLKGGATAKIATKWIK